MENQKKLRLTILAFLCLIITSSFTITNKFEECRYENPFNSEIKIIKATERSLVYSFKLTDLTAYSEFISQRDLFNFLDEKSNEYRKALGFFSKEVKLNVNEIRTRCVFENQSTMEYVVEESFGYSDETVSEYLRRNDQGGATVTLSVLGNVAEKIGGSWNYLDWKVWHETVTCGSDEAFARVSARYSPSSGASVTHLIACDD